MLSIFLNNIQAKCKQVMAALEADKDLNKIGNIVDKQAGYLPYIAAIVYGCESSKLAGSTMMYWLWF
jgi:hypothetical protein